MISSMKATIKRWFNWTTPEKRFATAFWLGVLFNTFIMLFLQDYRGKEAYIAYVAENWTNIHWAVWIPLIIGVLLLYNRNRQKFEKEMAWMLIKNPMKVNVEADAAKPNVTSSRWWNTPPPRPPPPPTPPPKK